MTQPLLRSGLQASLLSLAELLARQAAEHGDRKAFIFLPERGDARISLTFTELDRRARTLAARLLRQASPGDRALLLFPPGLDFVVSFFGCLAAGLVAVPLMVPRRAGARDSSEAIVADCGPRLALTSADMAQARPDIIGRFGNDIAWVFVNATEDAAVPAMPLSTSGRETIAFLQYTSGSTSAPKGVMVGNGNMLANLEMIRFAMSNTPQSTCLGWVPPYHDMGLMMGVLQPLYLGALSVLMPPAAFMMRPLNWLRAISQFGAEVTSAPNFAFDLCVSRFRPNEMKGIDLSCWKLALNGAEPVQADTIARFTETFAPYGFDARAMYPGYGLAEGTLLVTGGTRGGGVVRHTVSRTALQQGRAVALSGTGDTQELVACGRSMPGERVAIVDPETLREVPACTVGEIWVSGPNVAQGYWHNATATEITFRARIVGDDDARWLRTGDLGFLDESGRVYVVGRIKDVIIIRGMNHYPQDIERTMQNAHPALRMDCGAAFAVLDEGVEKVVLVQEVERTRLHNTDFVEIILRIRDVVTREHEIAVHEVALLRPASMPKTTSGKVRRSLTRELWRENRLDRA